MSTRKTKTQEEKPMTEEVTPMEGQIDVTELVLPDKDYSKMNIYQKLIEARMLFLQANVKKTGLNRFHKFKYFELSDIVPPVTKIFHKVGLVFITKFTLEQAIGTLVNTDNMIQAFDITLPMKEIDCIENKEGGKVTNPIQNLGTVETYQRRYLYLSLMDIVEVDEMDATVGEKESAVAPAAEAGASKKPASQIERGEIKDKLLNGDNATALQVKSLKKVIAKLIEVDPTTAEDMQAVVEKSEGFAKTTKEEAEKLILGLGAMLEERMNK